MHENRTGPAAVRYKATPTKRVYQRGSRFVVRWNEHGKRIVRTFATYEDACAFVRDYVQPYRQRRAPLPPSTVAPGKGDGWVYVFRSAGPNEPVKIGFSSDPATRLRDLRLSMPYKLELVLLLPGTRALEKEIHARLSSYRLEREWFSREAEQALTRILFSGFSTDLDRIIATREDQNPGFAGEMIA